jgi:oligopeptidase A
MKANRMSLNPLLDFSALPRFADIRAEHVTPAVDVLLQEARDTVARLTQDSAEPDWDNFVEPLCDATERLSRCWGVVGHLNAVVSSPQIRDAYNGNIPRLSAFWSEMGQNLALYARFKALCDQPAYSGYGPARKTIVENNLRDFKLSGAELPEAQKERFAAIQSRLAELSARFEQNVLDATDAFSLYVETDETLQGLPADVQSMLAAAARQEGKAGYKLTLQFPCYLPVMQYADNRELRHTLYDAYVKRASEFGPREQDNSPVMREKLQLNREEALLLGFADFAELSLYTKMAESPAQVIDFLRDLAHRARPFALRDRAELEAFAREELGMTTLEAWDLSYVSEKLRVSRYAFSDQEVKQYFPEPRVLAGLFGVVGTLFGVEVRAATAEVWHPDVRFYEILRDGSVVGSFYFDLYAREGKRSGAWMDDARGRRVRHGSVQTPVAYLTCNFSGPLDGKPALFTHDEVTTLFHEFGHGLHHMLTQVDELSVSGINGVEWDAVELPSQFMENFCWEWDVLQGMSAHIDSGEPLPRALYDKMIAARNFESGMQTVRQLEFALFDMLLYSDFDVDQGDWLELLAKVREEVAVNMPPAYNRFPNSFGHIFAGGYAAGYYSYKWAEVLSADAYSAFEEAGGANPQTGERFWREILAVGGSRPALESFRAFRGRDPQIDALLRHSGMIESAASSGN